MNPEAIKQAMMPAGAVGTMAGSAGSDSWMSLLKQMLPMLLGGALGGAKGANSVDQPEQQQYSVGNIQAPAQPRYNYGDAVKQALMMKGY